MPEDFKAGFLKALWILRDYLSVIVIGGGWVPLLYYHYLLADKSRKPIRTRDIDLLVDIHVPMVGDKTVDRLLLEAGFKPTFRSSDTPPVVHYEGTIDGDEVEIEFLTDQRGAMDDIVIEVQQGLHAEALRSPEGRSRKGTRSSSMAMPWVFPKNMDASLCKIMWKRLSTSTDFP